jgi:hypothetical protein
MVLDGKDTLAQLHSTLQHFKDVTLKLIASLEQTDYDALEGLLQERQELIEVMESLEYSRENFNNICSELEIMPLQQKLTLLINKNRAKVKNELDKVRATKTANKSYNQGYKVDSLFFNKKI